LQEDTNSCYFGVSHPKHQDEEQFRSFGIGSWISVFLARGTAEYRQGEGISQENLILISLRVSSFI
jgi:hypothetical protein